MTDKQKEEIQRLIKEKRKRVHARCKLIVGRHKPCGIKLLGFSVSEDVYKWNK